MAGYDEVCKARLDHNELYDKFSNHIDSYEKNMRNNPDPASNPGLQDQANQYAQYQIKFDQSLTNFIQLQNDYDGSNQVEDIKNDSPPEFKNDESEAIHSDALEAYEQRGAPSAQQAEKVGMTSAKDAFAAADKGQGSGQGVAATAGQDATATSDQRKGLRR